MTSQADLDDKDLAILDALQLDGRMSLSELGRTIGLSQPAMSERVKRLEDRGIILGYGARISLQALGLRMTWQSFGEDNTSTSAPASSSLRNFHIIEVHELLAMTASS
jgi:DNA-binding Lrp family transcriptional regulator